jgi:hypothetical protein
VTRPRLLVIGFSALSTDPRVQRQLRALSTEFDVTAAGFTDPGIDGVTYVPVAFRLWDSIDKASLALRLKARRYENVYWSGTSVRSALRELDGSRFDAILANDIHTLPLALRLAGSAKVILDAHEYAPAEFEDVWRWRFFFQRYNEYLCARYLPRVTTMMTVSCGIAAEYRKRYGVGVSVIVNASPYTPAEPGDIMPHRIRLIHHGVAIPSRRLELMLDMVARLDKRFFLDLMLVPTVPSYLHRLRALAAGNARVRILPPIPMRDLISHANGYDIGVILYPSSNFNMLHALPNKFFEFIQARLALALGPSAEMAPIAKRYGCGIVADDFNPASLANALNRITCGELAGLKRNTHRAARELCYEQVSVKLLSIVRDSLR